jgi:hypothetical protein
MEIGAGRFGASAYESGAGRLEAELDIKGITRKIRLSNFSLSWRSKQALSGLQH